MIGRAWECDQLAECMERPSAQLIAVYGRRRVGKTFLINEFFQNHFAFKVTGAYGENALFQMRSFTDELHRKCGRSYEAPDDWRQVFLWLREYLESLPADEKQVIFMDEMPWLETYGSSFLNVFEWFWNDWASTRKNLVFIVCGSSTTWMVERFAKNRGGLYNRLTCRIDLRPFNLHETELFLQSKGIQWSRDQIAECYICAFGISSE